MPQEFVVRNGLKILDVTTGSTSDQLLVYNTSTGLVESKTAEPTDPFPYSGDAEIIGSLAVTGQTDINGGLIVSGGSADFYYDNITSGSWSTGGSLITARSGLAGAGTQNAGLAIGGRVPAAVSCTEEYDGSSWSAGGNLSTARYYLAGAGTQNAGLAFGGAYSLCTEEYDGSSWSAGGALINQAFSIAGTGEQNAALAFGGTPGYACTEEYNGSTWSAGGALINGRLGYP